MITPRLLSERDAANYLGVSMQFLRKSRMAKKIPNSAPGPPFIKIGRMVRYDIADLDTYIISNRPKPNGKLGYFG